MQQWLIFHTALYEHPLPQLGLDIHIPNTSFIICQNG